MVCLYFLTGSSKSNAVGIGGWIRFSCPILRLMQGSTGIFEEHPGVVFAREFDSNFCVPESVQADASI